MRTHLSQGCSEHQMSLSTRRELVTSEVVTTQVGHYYNITGTLWVWAWPKRLTGTPLNFSEVQVPHLSNRDGKSFSGDGRGVRCSRPTVGTQQMLN